MCFSAGASFTAGALLSVAGAATLMEARKQSQKLFGVIPLIFAVQQFAEGCLWLILQNPDNEVIRKISTYTFLIAADIIWPSMIPLSILLMEKKESRKKILKILLVIGIIVSTYYAALLMIFNVVPRIENCHIKYISAAPKITGHIAFLLYLIVTLTPLFITTVRRMYILGILMFLSILVTVIFYIGNITSVWCFFAAVLSVAIFWILRGMNRAQGLIGAAAEGQEGS